MSQSILAEQPSGLPKPLYIYHVPNKPALDPELFDLDGLTETPKYRFILCGPVLDRDSPRIQIHEYQELPAHQYTVISHVWKGLPADPQDAFEIARWVQGENGRVREKSGSPISLQLLQDACRVAQMQDTKLLWLDRLCMNKADKKDEAWQIKKMYEIYQKSAFCIVFPGGLGRLADLNEETTWIHRGWTLQEAVAPQKVEVIFRWSGGESTARPYLFNHMLEPPKITVIGDRDRCAAMAPLSLLLDCTMRGELKLITPGQVRESSHSVSMFGARSKINIAADYRLVLPHVAALAVLLIEKKKIETSIQFDPQRYHHAIWKSAMMRSTSVPADMIFSIMGLFDVDPLEPQDFPDQQDIVKPAIALAKRLLLAPGGRATWLGVSFFSPPCPYLSTFPSFPKAHREGDKPTVAIPGEGRVQALQLMLNEYVDPKALRDMPFGEMSDSGYLALQKVKSIPVSSSPPVIVCSGDNTSGQPLGPQYYLQTINGDTWYELGSPSLPGGSNEPEAFAVLLGCFKAYSPFKPVGFDASSVRGFIVKQQKEEGVLQQEKGEKFYLDSYFMLTVESSGWIKTWSERDLCVGGRLKFGTVDRVEVPDLEIDDYIPRILGKLRSTIAASRPGYATRLLGYIAGLLEHGAGLLRHLAGLAERAILPFDTAALRARREYVGPVPESSLDHPTESRPARSVSLKRVSNRFFGTLIMSGPPTRPVFYKSVAGEPWQKENRWTSQAMEDLREQLKT
ncbi:hypothetical protein FRC12_002428 [Ceratobasidium sp. 428]|nr:hypothetical protein FRC12_002428 [Ceratobasidium sp. 428]